MRAVLAGAALTLLVVSPTFADYYVVQEPSTKRCRIVEERPAPGVGVLLVSVFALKLKAECAQSAARPGPPARRSLRNVNGARRDDAISRSWKGPSNALSPVTAGQSFRAASSERA